VKKKKENKNEKKEKKKVKCFTVHCVHSDTLHVKNRRNKREIMGKVKGVGNRKIMGKVKRRGESYSVFPRLLEYYLTLNNA